MGLGKIQSVFDHHRKKYIFVWCIWVLKEFQLDSTTTEFFFQLQYYLYYGAWDLKNLNRYSNPTEKKIFLFMLQYYYCTTSSIIVLLYYYIRKKSFGSPPPPKKIYFRIWQTYCYSELCCSVPKI